MEAMRTMGVSIRRHLQRDALMQPVGGDAIQIVPWHLKDGDAGIGGQPYGFAEPFVGLCAVEHEAYANASEKPGLPLTRA